VNYFFVEHGDTNLQNGDTSGAIRRANKVCRVCGAQALGYNFDAVTCESCKAFFRRNALRHETLRWQMLILYK
jgi:hypothetical protein